MRRPAPRAPLAGPAVHARSAGRARCAALALGLLAAAAPVAGQQVTRLPDGIPRGSQPAELVQRVGATEITLRWNRPTARGRVLFGGLVPWDSIWNPGADEATRIELSAPVRVNGEQLPAGRYSIWAIPGRETWTLVFSRAWDVFHRPYPEGQDALRLQVVPDSASHVESLLFHFPMATRDSARLELRWGTVSIPLDLIPVESTSGSG
jgi:hypothetical protein